MSNDGGVRILFATDGSAGAAVALELLSELPLRPSDEVVVVSYPAYLLAARPDGAGLVARLMEGQRRAAFEVVEAAAKRLTRSGVRTTAVVQDGLEAVDAILRVAVERHVELIVLGSRGLGRVSSLLVGSTARALAILSPVPVLVVRDRRPHLRRVLIAVDGSHASRAGLEIFTRLPLPKRLSVELLHVLPTHRWSEVRPDMKEELSALRESVEREEAEHGWALLRDAAALVGDGATIHTHAERGHVSDVILARAAALGADLIVLGSRGANGPRQLLWGGTAERVMVASRCSVLIAPVPQAVLGDEPPEAGSREKRAAVST
jgi:nucleotide-binding universal stress UspA family protein